MKEQGSHLLSVILTAEQYTVYEQIYIFNTKSTKVQTLGADVDVARVRGFDKAHALMNV